MNMDSVNQYTPGPASEAGVRKNGEKWTLILVRDLRHAPDMVWAALTDCGQVREWAPFDVTGNLEREGSTVSLTWSGTGNTSVVRVTRVQAPNTLEFGDIRWELEPIGAGTRLTLWHNIDRRYISWGAAGWHICFDVLERMLSGNPISRIAGADAMKLEGWKKLTAEYQKQFEQH
jgi:uncharacterized protein YndB with AHSA1/START domain